MDSAKDIIVQGVQVPGCEPTTAHLQMIHRAESLVRAHMAGFVFLSYRFFNTQIRCKHTRHDFQFGSELMSAMTHLMTGRMVNLPL